MLSGKYKALLVKLFYMNEESATVAQRKFRLQKNVQTGKRSLTVAGLIMLVQRFEKTGSLEDRVRSGRPSIWQTLSVLEALASESSVGSNSAREAGRRLAYHHHRYAIFFMEFLISIHINFSLVMNFYCRISQREKHLRDVLSPKLNKILHWILRISPFSSKKKANLVIATSLIRKKYVGVDLKIPQGRS
ncbi:hypothetical protein NPIL_53751 [Nephila pilipes]|uniref:DUF4817 domain-containing protein n=1 Tax=Nephila pilipes TaxID=299642 RepID=A0A8X6PAI6_NEPPI|nr:hypothetical protein NPIL_53751 [Nephila pilipes]